MFAWQYPFTNVCPAGHEAVFTWQYPLVKVCPAGHVGVLFTWQYPLTKVCPAGHCGGMAWHPVPVLITYCPDGHAH